MWLRKPWKKKRREIQMGNNVSHPPNEKKRYQNNLRDEEDRDLNELVKKEKLTKSGTTPVRDSDGVDGECCSLFEKRLTRKISYMDYHDKKAASYDPADYHFPFENLVFEGGGNKGLAYVGCLQYLENHNMLKQIKRFAGASAGAITAGLVALGYNSNEIYDFLSDNIEQIFLDHSCGYFSLLPNLLTYFGWNPGKKIFEWFGDKIKAKSARNDPDMTFYDLYKEKGIELCVVVTNLNQMRTEYCHPKTTPDLPLRDALRMSMAIPGVFGACKSDHMGDEDVYVDGGVLCNYPIHCYDGWYLSMKKEDAFLIKLQPLRDLPTLMAPSNRFGSLNHKTMGCLLYDDTEMEVMRFNLEKRVGSNIPECPCVETNLYLEKEEKKAKAAKAAVEHRKHVIAIEAFMKALHKHNKVDWEHISKEELRAAMNDTEIFSQEMAKLLFGKHGNVDEAFNLLDKDGNGLVAFMELLQFVEEKGVRMQARWQGFGRRNVRTFPEFLDALQGTLLTNMKYVFVKDMDEDRTIGINTGHVGTADYNLVDEDRDFVVKRGYHATQAFLKYFLANFLESHPSLIQKKSAVLPPCPEETNGSVRRRTEDWTNANNAENVELLNSKETAKDI